MQRIDYILLGYRQIKVPKDKLSDASNILLKLKIAAKLSSNGSFVLKENDFKRLKPFAKRLNIEFSELMGLPGIVLKNKYRVGTLLGFFVAAVMIFILSNTVWELRLENTEELSDTEREEIISALSESGLYEGRLWWAVDENQIENGVLKSNPQISWISLYRRGTVAYVELSLKEGEADLKEEKVYSNVVAIADAVIEEITVSRGVACVSPGDVVKRGDILISGIYSEETGGGFCHAEGVVKGIINQAVTVEVSRNESITESSEPVLVDKGFKFFNLNINIFKKYRNSLDECVIIKKEKDCIRLEGRKLPFSVIEYYAVEEKTVTLKYTDAQMVSLAKERMEEALREALSSLDLIKLKTVGEFTEDGYRMQSKIVCSAVIGEDSPFSAEE